jgi:hypothetical protein
LKVETDPVRSTATQKVDVAHETAFTPPLDATNVVPGVHFNEAAGDAAPVTCAEPGVAPRTLTRALLVSTANAIRAHALDDDGRRRTATCMIFPRKLFILRRSLTSLSLLTFLVTVKKTSWALV